MKVLSWVSLCVLLATGCGSQRTIVFGTAPGGPGLELTDTLTTALEPTESVSTIRYTDVAALVAAVQSREVDFGIIEQPHSPMPDLAVATPVFPSVLHVLVDQDIHRCDTPIQFSELLTQGSVYAGVPGSAGYDLLGDLANSQWLPPLATINMLDNAFGEPPQIHVEFGEILHPDAARRLQGYCLASLGDVTKLGRGTWAEGLSYRYPHLKPYILPAGLYPNLNQRAVLTLAVTSMLVTHPDTDTDMVYDVVETAFNISSQLSEIYPLAGETIHADHDHELYTLPVHAGAWRFSQRNAPTFLERYAEILAFSVTLLVALSSALVAFVRIRRQAKKDRIDAYFSTLLSHRAELSQTDRAQQVEEDVRNLQRRVTELVVSERIQADSAYLAFLNLSDQVMREAALMTRATVTGPTNRENPGQN
ncbi:MAG: TAXI family TRAP transporter solute-binding subunit [Pseudomonadota bacterium]